MGWYRYRPCPATIMSATREPSAWSGAIPAGSTDSARRRCCASSKPTGSAAAGSSVSRKRRLPPSSTGLSALSAGQDSTLAANTKDGVGNLLGTAARRGLTGRSTLLSGGLFTRDFLIGALRDAAAADRFL